MKNIYLLLVVISSLLYVSCYDDKGNYDYGILNTVSVSGVDSFYRKGLLDRLEITPNCHSGDKDRLFDYQWMCFKKTGSNKIDTISQEKDLDWLVSLNPGEYRLVFEYKDRQTGVVDYVMSQLVVESQYSRGWYVMKQQGETTDIDFFSSEFQNTDLLHKIRGSALSGAPQSLGFTENYAYVDEISGELVKFNPVLFIVTKNELQVLLINGLRIVGDFNSLFFEEQPVIAPGLWFAASDEVYGFMNDGKLFTMDIKTSPIGAGKFDLPVKGDYQLSPVMTKHAVMCPLLFDMKSGKFCTVRRNDSNLLYLNSDSKSLYPDTYLDREPLYAGFLDEGGLNGGKGYIVMQRKNATRSLQIFHIDLNCLVSYESEFRKNRIIDIDEIPMESKLNQAMCFGMNMTYKMLYFAVDDKLYIYDLQNRKDIEVLRVNGQTAIPAGESIVKIKHIVFNKYDAQDEVIDKLAVCTKIGECYKLYLFDITANKLKENPEIYEGEGMPTEVMYMSSRMECGYLCY